MSDCKTHFFLSLSIFGTLLGISAGITFAIYENEWAVFWSFLSAAYALMNVFLHFLYSRDKLEEFYNINVLQNINCFAFISTTIFSAFLMWYIFMIFFYDRGVFPIRNSIVIIAVWCFMSAKWACMLVSSSYRYVRILSNSGRPLLQT